jgi:hypothetical protein
LIYTFKLWFEDREDLTRTIEIKATSTFLNFHNIIQEAIGFNGLELSSFYICDDSWNKGMEITQMDMDFGMPDDPESEELSDLKPYMRDTRIGDSIQDPHQQMIYVTDFIEMWTLKIQLKRIGEEIVGINYPRVTESVGEAPKQEAGNNKFKMIDDVEMDDIAKQIMNEHLGAKTESDLDSDIMDEFNDLESDDSMWE